MLLVCEEKGQRKFSLLDAGLLPQLGQQRVFLLYTASLKCCCLGIDPGYLENQNFILQISCLYHTAGISVTHKSCYFKVREVLENITGSLNVPAYFTKQDFQLIRDIYTSSLGHSPHGSCSKSKYSKWHLWVCCHPIYFFICQTTILSLSGEQPYTNQPTKQKKTVAKRRS